MTTQEQLKTVRGHVVEALDAGTEAVVGGACDVTSLTPFLEPVVLLDPPEDGRVVLEETFGPVLTLHTVTDVEEAVRRANASPYQLGASVFSRRHGPRIADGLDAGMVAVNCGLAFVGIPSLPFGGSGESGFGRIHGADGLREFARPRSYARRVFDLPGVDPARLRRPPLTMRAIRLLVGVRHEGLIAFVRRGA